MDNNNSIKLDYLDERYNLNNINNFNSYNFDSKRFKRNKNYKLFLIFIICIIILFSSTSYLTRLEGINTKNEDIKINSKNELSGLINENFFILDSNNLHVIKSHLYGYIISKDGILTDDFYKTTGKYDEPLPQGVYIMIRKNENEIIINQDFYGSIGLYMYENKEEKYFALSNSFLLLEEYLLEKKKKLSLNKDFSDNLIVSSLCSYSIEETLINEIKQITSNAFIVINIKMKDLKIYYKNYEENSIPLESAEGLAIIDNWIDKWGYIFRSLKKQTNNISGDLSGGFDTRTMITVLLNAVNDMNELNIHSIKDKKNDHQTDFNIGKKISLKFGFKLNNYSLDNNITNWSVKDTILTTIYTKLGFHKQFYLKQYFYNKPRFSFTGSGGEFLRGYPNAPIERFLNMTCSKNIKNHEKEFYHSSENIFNRSISFLKNQKIFINDYEISYDIYTKSIGRNHFGKAAFESFMTNSYTIQPLMDPDIKKIKYNINKGQSHDLIAYIMVRFAHDLINFPFQGNRTFDAESIKKAERLNNYTKPYKKKYDYNQNFFIDNKRKSPVNSFVNNNYSYEYLIELFKSSKYINIINKIYDKNVYNWANHYSYKTNYHPLTQHYALLAIAIIFQSLSSKEKLLHYK